MKAINALLKTGDKDQIITFASKCTLIIDVSKSTEIYAVAANFLQSLKWYDDESIMKTIVQFYTKVSII